MKPQPAPRLEKRRAADFERELVNRARAWIPSWSLDAGQADLGLALLKVAARFSSEVAERLDVAGNKMALGFLDWLGLAPNAARPARMPVVLKMTDNATESVLAPRPIKMQVDVGDATVTFETETDLRVIPGQLAAVVAADPESDAYYLPPPGLTSLDPLQPLPTAWKLKNFVAANSATLQLDPGLGLAEGLLIAIGADQYRVVKAQDDLVTIDPPIPSGDGLPEDTDVSKVGAFDPFNGARNLQEHVVYIGDADVLNVEAAARIEVSGLEAAPTDASWEYWGKGGGDTPADAEVRWRSIDPEPSAVGVSPAPPLVLDKPKGSLETTQIGSVNSRWIRAKIAKSTEPVVTDGVTMRINPRADPSQPPDALTDPALESELPPLEIIVNTTPSATSNFYLLGREPRLLDTVYFGSAEAFSKPKATAWIQFDLGDSSFVALSTVRTGLFADSVIAGVGMDGALHLFNFSASNPTLKKFRDCEPLLPPYPARPGSATGRPAAKLDRPSQWKLPTWSDSFFDFRVAAASAADVWIWEEELVHDQSGWRFGGNVPSNGQGPIDGLVYLNGPAPRLFALRDEVLFWRSPLGDDEWKPLDTAEAGAPIKLKAIVPVMTRSFGALVTSTAAGLIGVSSGANPKLYKVAIDGTCTSLPVNANYDFSLDVLPAAGADPNGANLVVVASSLDRTELVAHDDGGNAPQPVTLIGDATGAIEILSQRSEWTFIVSANDSDGSNIASWTPLGISASLFETERPATYNELAGGPLALPGHLLAPGSGGEIFVIEFDLSKRVTEKGDVGAAVVIPASTSTTLLPSDTVALLTSTLPAQTTVKDFGITKGQETFYPTDSGFPANASEPLLAYKTSGSPRVGTIIGGHLDQFTLAPNDNDVAKDHWLLIDGNFYKVLDFKDAVSNPRIVEIDPALPNAGGNGHYFVPVLTGGKATAFLNLDPLTNGNWDATLLDRVPLVFPDDFPERQRGKAFQTDVSNHPILVVLENAFTVLTTSPATFVIDAAVGNWTSSLGDTSANPALAWEYWNGTGWWNLHLEEDKTHNFKTSGFVQFKVPDDLKPTEWAGKTNHWIRARLIGGDYGKETVVVETQDKGGGKTEQTVNRTTEGIQPPYALSVRAAYAVDEAVVPTFVLTQDSGALRDQSDANRTPRAMIEVFTPLSVTLGRFDAPPASQADADKCVPDCACTGGDPSNSPKPGAHQSGSIAGSASPSIGARRAIYLGFTSKLLGAPVQVLFVVAKEGAYDAIAPLKVDALIGDRFTPIVADDHTRALGETGLLQMVFDVAPLQAELFGQPLSWLRIAPNTDSADWNPSIAGIYLNGVWCQSAETMTRELLGSSGGQPGLTVTVARPPLLQDSLQLRVREPLGEEERTALLDEDPNSVVYDLPDLPGDWVLWNKVADPTDWGPNDRVYGLDEPTGTVAFGDGLHGMIPPAGTDCIVAFSYRRTDPTSDGVVAANLVTARSELNLVTPVDSVESVVAADQSAGGLAPESPERVLEFAPAKLRNRGRAVSLQDFEDLALENGDKVVQARCFARNGRARLTVVMRGPDPMPTRAQQRELRQMLLDAAPITFAAPGALAINGPNVRKLRVALRLGVENLDNAGTVAKEVKQRLVDRFNSELDGDPRHGWALGRAPRPEDLAEALLDIENLESIISIDLVELNGKDGTGSSLAKVGPADLITLAVEDILIGFDILETAA